MSCCDSLESNLRLILAVLAVSFGSGFQNGFHMGIQHDQSPAYRLFKIEVMYYKEWPNLTSFEMETLQSWFVPLFLYGTITGAILIPLFADKLGRKRSLSYNNLFVFVTAFLLGLANRNESTKLILAGRFFSGLSVGLNSGLVPIYLTEISPVRWRGFIASFYPLITAFGNFLGEILMLDFALRFHKMTLWIFLFMIIPSVFQLVALNFCPESPGFLLSLHRGDNNFIKRDVVKEAAEGLHWLRGDSMTNSEIAELTLENDDTKKFNIFSNPYKTPLLIGMVIMALSQLTPTTLFSFSEDIFQSSSITSETGLITIGIIICLMTINSMILVESIGRKLTLICGLIGMAFISLFLFAGLFITKNEMPLEEDKTSMLSYINLTFYLIFFALYSTSLLTISTYLTSEISTTQKSRALTVSIVCAVGWTAYWAFSGVLLHIIVDAIGLHLLLIYPILLLFGIVFLWFKLPETLNASSTEIRQSFYDNGQLHRYEATLV